ncbi:putative quinol monooxygenase [Methanobrevibacter filiformis]|uniref:Putative monooxygenase YcnE n=1 Tax=Methanobrevibacter filiformis TaxID=55758 RepID=A0A166CW40_9EURY|nr:putative quinol monooxygenase [Methanobrevibacter filiformis]KZX14924.1 putative monooxygenase YcnE [Methanobrevibacter filiformis]
MIFVLAKMVIKNSRNNEFLKATENLIEKTRLETGNISYNLYADTEENNVFMMVEQWENNELLDKHLNTDHFKDFEEEVKDILAEEIDIRQYTVN